MNGRLLTIDKREYELLTGRMRSTDLKELLSPQGPRAYYWNVIHRPAESMDDAERWNTDGDYRKRAMPLMMGGLFHELLTEGRIAWHESDVTRNVRHKEYQAVLDAAEGRPILNPGEIETLHAWLDGAMRNKEIRRILEGPRLTEQAVLWEEAVMVDGEVVEVPSKLSYDLWCPDARYCVKTTMTSNPQQYRKQVHERQYHVSAAFYERGAKAVPELAKVRAPFKHIVVCKDWPHYSYVWEMSRVWINQGHRLVVTALSRYARGKLAEARGDDPMDAWPDFLEHNDDARYMVPDVWMMEKDGTQAGEYDPFEEFYK